MKTLYLDCFAGAAGDMLVGTLVSLGVDPAWLESELQRLGLDGYHLQFERVSQRGVEAVHFKVLLDTEHGDHLADSEFQETASAAPAPADPAGKHTHADPEPHSHSHPHRSLSDILQFIARSDLPERVRERASAIFTRLGAAEARVHGGPAGQVHLHEVGGVDAMLDVVGVCLGLEYLGIEQVLASPLPLGNGFIRFSHGLYPVPAPATAYLLEGAPVYASDVKGELITPTGAALISTLCAGYGPLPLMTLQSVGYGAGSRQREFPNVVRGFVGESAPWEQGASQGAAAPVSPPHEHLAHPSISTPPNSGYTQDNPAHSAPEVEPAVRESPATPVSLSESGLHPAPRTPFPEQHTAPAGPQGYHEGPAVVLEANIDDMNPQLFQHLLERLLGAGALDCVLIPVQMKKNRPGILLHVLAAPGDVDTLLRIIFREATTLGVRTYPVTKRMLQRETVTVQTALGPVRVKLGRLGDEIVNLAPEYEDCRRLAESSGMPLKDVIAMAVKALNVAG